jgi:hypothetical protein
MHHSACSLASRRVTVLAQLRADIRQASVTQHRSSHQRAAARSEQSLSFNAASEEPMSEHFSEHGPTIRTLRNFMELAPQTSSTNQEQLVSGNIRPWDAEHALFLPTIRAWVDKVGCCGKSGFNQAQDCSHPFRGFRFTADDRKICRRLKEASNARGVDTADYLSLAANALQLLLLFDDLEFSFAKRLRFPASVSLVQLE